MIKLSEPHFFGNELYYLKKSLKEKWISSGGGHVELFQNKLKSHTNGKYNLGIINCTSALQLAIRLLNPKDEDEIIVPSITFVATVNSILYNNCKPIFIDCDENLFLDKNKFYEFVQKNTYLKNGFSYNKRTNSKILCIIIVNTFGNLFNYDTNFIKFCKSKKIKIIQDAAESLGSFYKNKKKIKCIEYSCYSFNGNKLITTGGGGVISTNSKKNYLKAIYLSSQAADDPINFIHHNVGYNFRMSNLHASIGLSQLENLNKVIKKKKYIHNLYKAHICKIKGLKILDNPNYCISNNWLNILIINEKKYKLTKNQIIKKFLIKKIETRSLWYPNHLQTSFKKFEKFKVKKSKKLFNNYLCLPSSFNLKKNDQLKIIKLLKNKFK
jgi:perosamine synthetase